MSKETYNGREIWYDRATDSAMYLEQCNGPNHIEFWAWTHTEDVRAAVDRYTVCIWYAKGTPRPTLRQN